MAGSYRLVLCGLLAVFVTVFQSAEGSPSRSRATIRNGTLINGEQESVEDLSNFVQDGPGAEHRHQPRIRLTTTEPTPSSLHLTETNNSTVITDKRKHGQIEQIPWLHLVILTFLIITAGTCCKFIRCQTCESCPMFEHRSEANNRYGNTRETDVMRSLNKRFKATEGYPNHPEVDPFQKYIGNQRLRRYREPNVCIVDDKDMVIADTHDIYDSIHNSTYIKSNGSNDDMRKYKFDLEEKRRKNIERQEMIERTKTTANHSNSVFSVYYRDELTAMSKRNTANDLEAISENLDESTLALQLDQDTSEQQLTAAPAYTSRENIFDYWKNSKNKSATITSDDTKDADAWSIHPPLTITPDRSQENLDTIVEVQPDTTPTFQYRITPPEDEITHVECSSSKSKR